MCGTNGVTYINSCFLRQAICRSNGRIQKARNGRCCKTDASLGLVGAVEDAFGVTGHVDIVAHVWKLVATFDVPTKQDVFMIPESVEQDVVSHCKLYNVQGFFDPVVLSINGRTIIYSSTELSCFQNSIFETHVWKNGILYSILKSLPKGL